MSKIWTDLFAFLKVRTALPPAEDNPLWEVRDRVRKALDEREADFCDWAGPRRRHGPFTELLRDIVPDIEQHVDIRDLETAKKEDGEDIYPFDGIIQSLFHVTLLPGFRLAAKLESCWGDSRAVFYAEENGRLLPLADALCLDGTPDACWEAVVLWFETAQFYRFGHANYEHADMVPDLRRFWREYSFCGVSGMEIYKELSREARNRLSRMEFRPTLEPSAVGCEVCFTTFAPFGGFTRNRLTVTKRDVGISISVHATGHVPYRCPFMF